MSTGAYLYRKPPAHHFTLSQLERPLGRVGRPTLLTHERRQVIEAAIAAEPLGVRIVAKVLAHRLNVSVPSVQRWVRRIREERRSAA